MCTYSNRPVYNLYTMLMANTDGGMAVIRNFAQFSSRYQRAITLKSQGVRHESIALILKQEFGQSCSRNTVNQWFAVGGLLEQALAEYNERIASESLRQADLLIRRAALPAAATLVRLLNDPNPNIQLRAAESILNKVFPKGVETYSVTAKQEEELPPELALEAEKLILQAS